MRLTIDGTAADYREGETVLDVMRSIGSYVPTLCQDDRISPRGSCRICLVEVDGTTAAACTTPASDGMVVRRDNPHVRLAARGALELIVSELPPRALDVPADRSELVRACDHFGITTTSFTGEAHRRGLDHSHPYVKLDRDLCIACGRCVAMCSEVQGTFALELVGRGFDTVVSPGAGEPWVDSPCVGCGGCVDSCPTGALSEPELLDPRPLTGTVTTTCGYCGVGCTLDVHLRGGEVAVITPTRSAPVNRGHACIKGRFAHTFTRADDRLTTPLIRRDGQLQETSWDDALGFVADQLTAIRAQHGPDAIGMISSARATNEENYLAQKFVRTVIGTNTIDNCSRLCHAPSAAGLTASFGLAGGTNCLDDLDRTDCVLLAGANPTEAHPVVGARIKQLVLGGAGLIVIDPRETELAALADVHLRLRPGTNVAAFNGLARLLLDHGHIATDFLTERAAGLDELTAVLHDYAPERVSEITGLTTADLTQAAELYGQATNPAIVYGLGVTEHAHGTDGVRTLANLAILRGTVGTPGCCGILPLRGQNNVQGASDMGALPDLLPGYQPITDPRVRERFARVWGSPVPERPGLRIPQMFDAAVAGELRALYVIGEDIAQSDPCTSHVEHALRCCDLVVCHDLFLSRTAELADVVLPAANFLEKDGTFVNFDRRVQRVRPALDPPGAAKTDFDILRHLAHALGNDLGCAGPATAMDECAALTPTFGGISHARLDHEGPLHWPCPDTDRPGQPVLHLDGFATPDGRAHLAACPYLPPGEQADAEFPFLLVTGRRLVHYNTGSMTRRTPDTELLPAETLDVHPADAALLGLTDTAPVEVTSRWGSVTMPTRTTREVSQGQVFAAFHFATTPTNALTSPHTDSATGCPEYKVTAVALRPG
ncbi:formate dehydrogenase major subunit [Saccharopolyspora erythraea NRRL 2338]|uniref:Formate dehydrogenase, alpha subunit n=2 Tax=Saccharopolyspora erythraea TaxID=1836 RepID=A4FCF5_SACEN|nr:formate dehydrogenase subunit alpha [Saccharopolyspora erythraea]EQD83892.1 molybdopterin oxidoreductase [Saccharopolyspora erythraea D]PFG95493.1 formate dehydrogenase major subunit [Saccharopolyspora erythraea NRRL 2338]QRK92120.1 formate dehydrogenase subunit alpha [Saccharopolyspora erythraea]CAM01730.1 formate dehydrogenase, alpha subunit [Saccharopolyspora erythraea NRRL 2338]